MNERRFINQSQPQTLFIATILLYIDAFFYLIRGAFLFPLGLLMIAALAAGAYGIANEKKWGYGLALVGAFLNFAFPLFAGYSLSDYVRADPIGLLFAIGLLGLLLHPMSRDYQRIWFK